MNTTTFLSKYQASQIYCADLEIVYAQRFLAEIDQDMTDGIHPGNAAFKAIDIIEGLIYHVQKLQNQIYSLTKE